MQIEHGHAEGDGVRLHYARAGVGPLMLFLHGFPEFWYGWRKQLTEFGRDHLALAPDQRGYNLSDRPVGVAAYRIDRLVADVAAIVRRFASGPMVLVGHDWGGAVAWSFAIQHPELVERLIILNAPHPVLMQRHLAGDPEQAAASQYMRRFRKADAEAWLAADDFARLRDFAFGDLGLSEVELQHYREAWAQPGALTAMLNWYRATPLRPPAPDGSDGPPVLQAKDFLVDVPTLVVWGERDAFLRPALLEGLEAFVSDLTVVRLPQAGHWLAHEAAKKVNDAIRDYLAKPLPPKLTMPPRPL
jgi:pimeloyl-ACP methyl ester carboxylesterase